MADEHGSRFTLPWSSVAQRILRREPATAAPEWRDTLRSRLVICAVMFAVWTVGIECEESLCVPAEWYDEETIRGDVLRQIRELETKAELELALEEFLPEGLRKGSLAELARVSAGDRGELVMAASKLSMDLLSVDEDEA